MFFRFMHSKTGRLLRFGVGGALLVDGIARNFALAVPMVLFGAVIAVSGVAGISVIEELYLAGVNHGYITPPPAGHRHA